MRIEYTSQNVHGPKINYMMAIIKTPDLDSKNNTKTILFALKNPNPAENRDCFTNNWRLSVTKRSFK